jgi:two-component system nitrate/nitrite response regulator NarL
MDADCHARAPITILIAAAVRLYREGLATALNSQGHLRIEGTASTSLEARAAARDLRPAVIILDVALDNILDLIRTLHVESSISRILAFAVREDLSAILNYAEAGADGFVTANSSVAQLLEAIERTAAGELSCSPRIAAQLLRCAAHRNHAEVGAAVPILTIREEQVFSLLKQGRSNKEIGATLNIAEATVKNHVHHVLEKLQVATRAQAAAATFSPPGQRPLVARRPPRAA